MSPISTSKMSNFRWVICALLFIATTVNYMDRQVLSLTWKDFIARILPIYGFIPFLSTK
jgi:MFS transporter, ACS family, hexuronate transporter